MLRKTLILTLLVLLPAVALGFAANNKKGKQQKAKKTTARTTKGFGAPPDTLDQVLDKFRTRMPENIPDAQECPCRISGKSYEDCCAPLHRGQQSCLSMTDVLRSRYTAFCLRDIKHVMDTTHQTCRDYREDRIAWAKDLNNGGMFDSFDFTSLEAGPEEAGADENEGFIKFKVTLRAKEDTTSILAGQETSVTERSRFLRNPEDGTWTYASGDVRSDVAGLEDTTLNS
jgi:SEC-C motif-containing protein